MIKASNPIVAVLLTSFIIAACAGPTVLPAIVSVSIDAGQRSVEVGATFPLSATVVSVGGASEALTWSSSDSNVATVSGTGLVTGFAEGETRITATSQIDASKSATALITVAEVPAVLSVTITDGPRTVAVGATLTLTATVATVGGASDALTWSSNDTSVASVSAAGEVTGVAAGQARITATSHFDTSKADSVLITVTQTPAVASVTINESSIVLTVGSTTSFTATVHATGGASTAITWRSDNPSVATIDTDGRVEAQAIGVAAITATSVFDPSKRATVAIAVQAAPVEPGVPATITVIAGDTQTATVASAVPIPPSVRVRDADATPLAGVSVTFTVTTGGGSIAPSTPVTTDADGIARLASWTLGTKAGSNGLQATVTCSTPTITTTFDATARPGAPSAATSTVTANPPTLHANGTATSQLTIRLKDAHDNNLDVGGATVTFATPSQGSIGSTTDHGNGTYTATYTAGTTAGTVTITPRLAGTSFANTTTINLTAAVLNVSIDQASPTVRLGDTLQLTASVDTVGGASTAVTWSSSDSTVATIDSSTGVVTALDRGSTSVTAISRFDTSQRSEVTLTVPAPMIFTIETNVETADTSVSLPLRGSVDVNIDWGDGIWTSATVAGDQTHTYATSGTYTIRIAGSLEQFGGGVMGWHAGTITSVIAWGDLGLVSLSGALSRTTSLTTVPSDLPPTVTDVSAMFLATNGRGLDVTGWDVSNVTNMASMFKGSEEFEAINLSGWDVSQVTDMSEMFAAYYSWPSGIEDWDVSNVTTMKRMFVDTALRAGVAGWDVSKVTDMEGMFSWATEFNDDISGWDVSRVSNMNYMLEYVDRFNQDLSGWCVTKILEEPVGFASGHYTDWPRPIWGTCPSD